MKLQELIDTRNKAIDAAIAQSRSSINPDASVQARIETEGILAMSAEALKNEFKTGLTLGYLAGLLEGPGK